MIEKDKIKKYPIGDSDKIEGLSITSFSDSDNWSKACKWLLMNVQWIEVVCKAYEARQQGYRHA